MGWPDSVRPRTRGVGAAAVSGFPPMFGLGGCGHMAPIPPIPSLCAKGDIRMAGRRPLFIVGALVFLLLAAACLYRLLVGLPITICGHMIGQTVSFFGYVIFLAISLILFRGASARD